MADPSGREIFRDRRANCLDPAADVIDFLMTVAANAGPHVESPIYETGGNGPKYSNPGGQFCAFHLRTTTPHVWGWLYGAERESLIADGFEPSAQDDWFKVKTLLEAVRLVKWTLKAHQARA